MKSFFNKNTITVGLVAGLGSEFITGLLVLAGILIVGQSVGDNIRWFGFIFIPILFILRYYAKKTRNIIVVKTIIVILFVSFLAFFALFLTTNKGVTAF